jgi:hypothetical protein
MPVLPVLLLLLLLLGTDSRSDERQRMFMT